MGEQQPSKKAIRASLRTLLAEASSLPVHISEQRTVEDGETRLDLACGGEKRSLVSRSPDVARFTLDQYLAEEDLVSTLMRLPESARRHRDREIAWKTAKKPCPNQCDEGRIQVMDTWMRCETCHGRGWVV